MSPLSALKVVGFLVGEIRHNFWKIQTAREPKSWGPIPWHLQEGGNLWTWMHYPILQITTD